MSSRTNYPEAMKKKKKKTPKGYHMMPDKYMMKDSGMKKMMKSSGMRGTRYFNA